jgi:hypothetical protein
MASFEIKTEESTMRRKTLIVVAKKHAIECTLII